MKYVFYIILFFSICVTLSYADAPCGIYGFVYDNNNQLAGNNFRNLYIINTNDASDSARYYYNSTTSYYVTNDVYELHNGTWRLQGEIGKNGTTYWSQWYVKTWEFPEYTRQDIHCNSTVRPEWNPD